LKMAPFDRSHTTSYSPSIVTIGLGCTVSKLFDVAKYCGSFAFVC